MRDVIRRSHVKAFLAVAVTCCLGLANVEAAPITYGDFAGSTVMYLDVTENTNSGDTLPLFGAPTVAGDVLISTLRVSPHPLPVDLLTSPTDNSISP